jgi:hypothetical protein
VPEELREQTRSLTARTKRCARTTLGRFPQVATNPFFMMPLWIGLSAALYSLGWSNLFAPIRGDTATLLIATSVIFLALAFKIDTSRTEEPGAGLNPWTIALITTYFVVAFVANGGIPVVQVLTGARFDIYSFGINGLHILMMSLTGYYGVRAFRAFVIRKQKLDLMAFAWILTLFIAIGSRSAASFLLFACAIIFFRSRQIKWFAWVALLVLTLALAFLFGVYGDYRLSHQIAEANGTSGNLTAILSLSGASGTFTQTGLSHSWLWSYAYAVSPTANLNQSLAYAGGSFCGRSCNLAGLALFEWVPDVFSPRIAGILGMDPIDKSVFLIRPDLTASTAFGSAAAYAGIFGALTLVALIVLVCWLTLRLLKGSTVREEGIAILSTIVFFSFFENMIVYTALLGQLVFAIVRAQLPERFTALVRFL